MNVCNTSVDFMDCARCCGRYLRPHPGSGEIDILEDRNHGGFELSGLSLVGFKNGENLACVVLCHKTSRILGQGRHRH